MKNAVFNQLLGLSRKTNLIPFILGVHGIGKTQRVKQYAKDNNMKLVVIDGSTLKEGELTGLPLNIKTRVSQDTHTLMEIVENIKAQGIKEDNVKEYVLAESMLQLTNVLKEEEGTEGIILTYSIHLKLKEALDHLRNGFEVLLFIDEINRVSLEVSQELLNFCQQKKINTADFSQYGKKFFLVIAGNPPEDTDLNFQVMKFNPAFMDRTMPIDLTPDFDGWMEWAITNLIDERILIFLEKNPSYLHQWFADEDRRGCTNRSWADLSSLIKGDSNEALKSASYRTAIRGTVGNAAGQAFISSLDDMKPLFKECYLEGKPIEKGETAFRQKLSANLALDDILKEVEANSNKVDKLLSNFSKALHEYTAKEATMSVMADILNNPKYKKFKTLMITNPNAEKLFAFMEEIITLEKQAK